MHPTPDQLIKIQQYSCSALPSFSPNDIEIIPFIATDNMVARSFTKWSQKGLTSIANKLPGLPCQLDHNWESVGTIVGLVFEAKILNLNQIPSDILNNNPSNSKIFQIEGYTPVIASVAFPKTSSLLSGIQLGALNSVSIGGFTVTDYYCSECNTTYEHPSCEHIPPVWWNKKTLNRASYTIRADTDDLGELSIVTIPDIPGAKIIINKYKEIYGY